ncbi:uncharacterized protein DUF4625 [Tenacibaculum adriaticum]|uniref:Uncharacterized protein DUF4625 n=1 Tax=Tenacibaculum adriaticum TaxID=413713 RepID=A0A5S5DW84_9FLAO|nr:DUF4625 domain-containing protein [Tenacibaculum adriaticum]TYQ00174.1 uncharacterized protein DUF4625 [Tenacibaculum adriaticum]
MKTTKQNFRTQIALYALAFFGLLITSCSNDDNDVQLPISSISEVEIGSANRGVIGRDFHFNVEVLAGDMIDIVQININPREDETYTHDWSFEIVWDEFKGVKNATVHKHFEVPEDAAEGKYDFVITVTDENGTKLEETFEVEIIDPANLPVDPKLSFILRNGSNLYIVNDETFEEPEEGIIFPKDGPLISLTTVQNVKDDGKIFILMIKKSLNHYPETIDDIDFSKAIVVDVYEHSGRENIFTFYNSIVGVRNAPEFIVGTTQDNNTPNPNSVDGDKSWENTEYYYGIVYTNTTHNISVHHYIDITVEGF